MELVPLSGGLRQRFNERQRQQLIPKLQVGLAVGAALFLSFAGWEWALDPSVIPEALPYRLAAATALLALMGVVRVGRDKTHVRWVVLSAVAVAAMSIAGLSQVVPKGDVYGIGSLVLVSVVLVAIGVPFRLAVAAFAVLLATAHLGFFVTGAPAFTFFAVGVMGTSSAVVAALILRVSERIALHGFRLEVTLEQLASTDALSQAMNRRGFEEACDKELDRARRHGFALSMLVIDIDHFKRINDRFGHPVGDAVIRAVAHALRDQLRSTDVLGRLGGEEFGVLLPHADPETAKRTAERLRAAVGALAVPAPDGAVRVTVSVGVATLRPQQEALQEVVSRADAALYAAKHAGRNRVVATVVS